MCRVKSCVSNRGVVSRFCSSFCRISLNFSGLVASSTAKASYSSCVEVTSSGKWIALRRLAATLLAKDSPMQVNSGNPAHKASLPVVWALYGRVSKKRSACRCLARCSGSGIRFAKISLSASTPRSVASFRKLLAAFTLSSKSQSTLPSVCLRIRIHPSKVAGVIL